MSETEVEMLRLKFCTLFLLLYFVVAGCVVRFTEKFVLLYMTKVTLQGLAVRRPRVCYLYITSLLFSVISMHSVSLSISLTKMTSFHAIQ